MGVPDSACWVVFVGVEVIFVDGSGLSFAVAIRKGVIPMSIPSYIGGLQREVHALLILQLLLIQGRLELL
jgi:hypothetical protein